MDTMHSTGSLRCCGGQEETAAVFSTNSCVLEDDTQKRIRGCAECKHQALEGDLIPVERCQSATTGGC